MKMSRLFLTVSSDCKEAIKEYLANIEDFSISEFVESAVLYTLTNVEDFDKFLIEEDILAEEDEEEDESEEEDEDTEETEEEDEEED